jgi:superfamily II DNA or RNA helicase
VKFGKTRSEADAAFRHESQGDELLLSLVRGAAVLPLDAWAREAPAAAGPLADILTAAEDERRAPDGRVFAAAEGDRLRLHPALVAGLDAQSASALGLPATSNLALDLKPQGRIDQDGFQVRSRWVRPGGRPTAVSHQGALITTDQGVRRIPQPLWSLFQAALALAEPLEKTERFQALAALKAAWPESARTEVEADGYLADLRVHHASHLSLHLGRLGPFDFDPVLFGDRVVGEAEDAGRALDEDLDNVLTPASQRLFAEDRFRSEAQARPVYVLRDGEYVFIDPALRPVLNEVRRLQDRPEPERRAFVLNPRRTLRERLGDEVAERVGLDGLFTETEQFSARVAGVDVWRAPVLPWLTPTGKNQWLPERFGLRVGDDYFVLPPENVRTVIDRLQAAADLKQPSATVTGLLSPATVDGPPPPDQLPVNDQVLSAARSLEPFAAAPDRRGMEEAGVAFVGAAAQGRLFLVVRENFDEVEFAPFVAEEGAPSVAGSGPVAPPRRLKTLLKAHQSEGLNWLARSAGSGQPGALLADDMGLGKTIQALAFMAWLQEEAEAGRRPTAPFLVVAPTGLLGTWRDEIAHHLEAPGLGRLTPAFGAELRALREEDGFGTRDIETGRAALSAESWRDAGVVLTTYETLRDYHFSFARTRFGLVVFDEIQKLKNPASQLTRAAKTLNATFTLGMTGTPVENRLQDLWSIMDVVTPGLLGSSREFESKHPPGDTDALGRLKSRLMDSHAGQPARVLRRMKQDALAGMPARTVRRFTTDMPAAQADAYRSLVVQAAAGASSGAMGRGGMLSTLAGMRGISLHPLDPRQAPADLEAYAEESARLSRALAILDEVAAKREKVLVFVEDLAMQERLAALVQARYRLAEPPARINGTVPGPRRHALVAAFQQAADGFAVMILSPKAGGVGLTLTAANHVIHLSRWWNPAVEDQATDRVFRIGQTKDVQVYLPMAVHPDPAIRDTSFDLRLDALIDRKRALTRDLFLPPDADDADLAGLFNEVSMSGPPEAVAVPQAKREPEDRRTGAQVIRDHDVAPIGLEPEAQSALRQSRPVLSLPKLTAESLGAKVWRVSAGGARPTDEVLALFKQRDLVHVCIRDPYALASRSAREAQVKLLAGLSKSARTLESVTIEYAPEVDGDLSEPQQRTALGALFSASFGAAGPRLQMVRRPRRSRVDDFHDRFIDIEIRHAGGAVRPHFLSLGRGAEALFDTSKQCTISYAPPTGS